MSSLPVDDGFGGVRHAKKCSEQRLGERVVSGYTDYMQTEAFSLPKISHIPIPALAGVTAYIGICLLEWGTWRRLPKMSRVDALGFLTTAGATLVVNAVLAVAIGCSFYVLRYAYCRVVKPAQVGEHAKSMAVGSAR